MPDPSAVSRQSRRGPSRDRRLLDQSVRALLRVSDWLRDTDTVQVEGEALDQIGEVIHAVEQALEEVCGEL
jgi:hypothetical protein